MKTQFEPTPPITKNTVYIPIIKTQFELTPTMIENTIWTHANYYQNKISKNTQMPCLNKNWKCFEKAGGVISSSFYTT